MTELLAALLSFPVAVFTALMGLTLLYWALVIVGTVDLDGGQDGAVDAAAKGALDAAAKGALDAAIAKGSAVEIGADGAEMDVPDLHADADGDVDVDAPSGGLVAALFAFLRVGRVPATITFSFISFYGWVASYLGARYLAPLMSLTMPSWLANVAVLVLTFLAVLPLASFTVRPFEKLFSSAQAKKRRDFVGSLCRIDTSALQDGKTGWARISTGSDDMVIAVRGDLPQLKRGDQAVIVDYDAEREVYVVEAYEALVEEAAEDEVQR